MMELKFKDLHLDGHHQQNDFRLQAFSEGTIVGYVDYSTYQDQVTVSFIESHVLRHGVATSILRELQRKYPKTAINFGFMTDEGKLLLESLTWNIERNQFFDALMETKSRLKARLDEIDNLWNSLATLTEVDRTETLKQIESLCWNETSDALQKIEQRLCREPEFFNYIAVELEKKGTPQVHPSI